LQKPIHVYLLEFTDAGRVVRIMWWINSVNEMFPMLDRVNSALEEALLANGITISFTTYNVRFQGSDQQEHSFPQQVRRQNDSQE
jgi:small-conductance mechanosensitive channel